MSRRMICFGEGLPAIPAFLAVLAILGLTLLPGPARAQQPTEAQKSAIRSSCQTDYRAHCASVTPGGPEALACLRRNAASLSSACQTAVNAIGGAPAKAATTTTPPAAASATPAQAPAQTPAAASPAPAPAKQAAQPEAFPPLSPREELRVLRTACGGDFRALCGGVRLGEGRAIGCLRANAAALSQGCKGALMRAAER